MFLSNQFASRHRSSGYGLDPAVLRAPLCRAQHHRSGGYLNTILLMCRDNDIKLIVNNINGIGNPVEIGNYDDDVLMLMYDDVVVCKADDLVDRNFKTI